LTREHLDLGSVSWDRCSNTRMVVRGNTLLLLFSSMQTNSSVQHCRARETAAFIESFSGIL
jgi:hypothetical protein